jgi:hypothetical protein
MQADAARFAPFPTYQYEPVEILGSGGFGTAFLCQDRYMQSVTQERIKLGHHHRRPHERNTR